MVHPVWRCPECHAVFGGQAATAHHQVWRLGRCPGWDPMRACVEHDVCPWYLDPNHTGQTEHDAVKWRKGRTCTPMYVLASGFATNPFTATRQHVIYLDLHPRSAGPVLGRRAGGTTRRDALG